MSKRTKWSCERAQKFSHAIAQKDFEQRLEEVLKLLLDKAASSKNAFSTKPENSLTPATHGEVTTLSPVAQKPKDKERVPHDEAV